ncbi:MAG: L-seryl-tRNA(Sec) selenium transferase [Kofleriaceae bacterium]
MQASLAQLPAVHLLADRAGALSAAPRWALVEAARRCVAARRAALRRAPSGERSPASSADAALGPDIDPAEVVALAETLARPSLRPVLNATGVVLHTNLGRAPLSAEARRAIDEVAAGYCNLEYDLDAGARGSRHDHLRDLLRQLSGAEDALVVNNNAAATVLGLAALAAGRDVVVSRGELVEIGGSFRLPEILALSGCRMREVGTTNKTHARDYRQAVGADTALLLKVHRSNFAIVGFTAEVSARELVALAAELGGPGPGGAPPVSPGLGVMIDLGSGAFLPAELQRAAGLPVEPTVAETVASGADLVSFSGDKLLGGPQAGILVGRAAAIARARQHPLMRALRPDKLTLAALAATLAAYRDDRLAEVPALVLLRRPEAELRAQAEHVAAAVRGRLADATDEGTGTRTIELTNPLAIEVRASSATVGGGAMPTAELTSWAVVLRGATGDAAPLDAALRAGSRPALGRLEDGALWLDQRAIQAQEAEALIDAVTDAIRRLPRR